MVNIIVTKIDSDVADSIIKEILDAEEDITVWISCSGGEVPAAMGIATALKMRNADTVGLGYVASSATMIFAAGKNRLVSKYATFLFHNITEQCSSWRSYKELQIAAEGLKIDDSVLERFITGNTDIPVEKYKELVESGRYIGSEEMVASGLATGYID